MSKLGKKLIAAAKEGIVIARGEVIAPLKTKRDHRRALKEIEGLMGAKQRTPDGDRLDVLVALVEAFEAKHYPIKVRRAGNGAKHRAHIFST